MQIYKCISAVVTICAILVNIHTDRQHFEYFIWKAQQAEPNYCT